MDSEKFIIKYVEDIIKRTLKKRSQPFYGQHILQSLNDGNDCIAWHLEKGEPFAAGRFGANELSIVISFLRGRGCGWYYNKKQTELFCNNAGFFPKNPLLFNEFAELMISTCANIDFIGVWDLPMEDYIIRNYMLKTGEIAPLRALEPWYVQDNPWTWQLKGKRVLVVHPFVNSIKEQYQKRKMLFPEGDFLPEFELKLIPAIQTSGGERDERFKNWFTALDYMHQKIMNETFDIAILGCGAYGFPLAVKIKEMGRQAIHMGGATQLLFGIKGKRWDNHPIVSRLYNENWIRPRENEYLKNMNQIENGCYW